MIFIIKPLTFNNLNFDQKFSIKRPVSVKITRLGYLHPNLMTGRRYFKRCIFPRKKVRDLHGQNIQEFYVLNLATYLRLARLDLSILVKVSVVIDRLIE
jgi:hypothetical protein